MGEINNVLAVYVNRPDASEEAEGVGRGIQAAPGAQAGHTG